MPAPPTVVQFNPANHASQVDRSAVVTVTFSKAIYPATITAASVQLAAVSTQPSSGGTGVSPVGARLSLSSDGTQLVITPTDLLVPNGVYRLTLTSAVTDRHGNPLSPRPLGEGQGAGVFVSDFTTAAIFKAGALPPDTLTLSLPQNDAGQFVGAEGIGQSLVCGGAQLAFPGTLVDFTVYPYPADLPRSLTQTTYATDANGNAYANSLCMSRCFTPTDDGKYPPGSFCLMVAELKIGDRVVAGVLNAFNQRVEIDAGNMRDKETGATVIDTTGGGGENRGT